MMNPVYHFDRMRELVREYQPSPERDAAARKIEEAERLLAQCQPTQEAVTRDLCSRDIS